LTVKTSSALPDSSPALDCGSIRGALLNDKNKALINAQEGATKALRQWRMNSEKK